MASVGRNDPCPCGSGRKYKQCCIRGLADRVPRETSAEDAFQAALAHHQAGRLPQAEGIYRQILEWEPGHAGALHFLGVMAHQAGNLDLAVDLMRQSIRGEPRNATYLCNLGCALHKQGNASDAAAALEQSLELDPDSAEANYNLGLALHDLGRAEAAVDQYRRAIAIRPGYAEAYGNLGYALYGQGNTAEAIAEYRQALALRPNYPETHYNLGNALFRDGKLEAAIASYRSAIVCRPDYADAHNNLGNALKSYGKLDRAVASYTAALDINPASAGIYVNLGIAVQAQRRFDEAIAVYRSGLVVGPESPELYFNLGNALQELGNLDDAVTSYREAIRLRPGYAEAHSNLGRALHEQGKIADAAAAYERALELKPDYAQAFSNLIYLHAFAHDIQPEEQCQIAAGWECAALSAEQRGAARERVFAYPPREGRKLRLGIVSAELGQHAVAEFLEPLLERLDRNRFHLSLYPTVERADPRAARLKGLADRYASLARLSDSDAAELVRSDRIDVLMDTSGHTNDSRLGIFAHRAAPVQCSYIGFWATTGLTEMDWYIANQSFLPRSDGHFCERIWRLPLQSNAYRGDASLPESAWGPSPDGTVRLGSFNKYSKIRNQTLALWAKVLHALPEAKLLLEDRTPFDGQLHPRILAGLASHGIAAGRIEFSPFAPGWERHMLLYNRLDIALDTIPFNSGTTAFDALWMGVPLVTLEGDWGGGRMGSGVLNGLGRSEWIAHNDEEYVAIVVSLARDVAGRKAIRMTQRARMAASPLCDRSGVARDLEVAFEAMFDDPMEPREQSYMRR